MRQISRRQRKTRDLTGLSEEELKEYYKGKVLNYLSRRKTVQEVRVYLRRLNCPEEIVEELLEFTDEYRFTDDEEYARCFILDSFRLKHHSRKQIQYDLRQKGLDKLLIEQMMEELNPSDEEAAMCLAAKRFKNMDDPQVRDRCGNYLYNHGFPYEVIEKVLQNRE